MIFKKKKKNNNIRN